LAVRGKRLTIYYCIYIYPTVQGNWAPTAALLIKKMLGTSYI